MEPWARSAPRTEADDRPEAEHPAPGDTSYPGIRPDAVSSSPSAALGGLHESTLLMRPIDERTLRASFLNASRKEVSDLTLPPGFVDPDTSTGKPA